MPYVDPATALDQWAVSIPDLMGPDARAPWRHALLANPDTRVVVICWAPGFGSVPHFHPHATETFQVVSGRLGFRLDDRPELDLGTGAIAIAHRGQVHGLCVLGDEPLVFLACVSPNEDRIDEQVDVPDRWPDWAPSPQPVGTASTR